MGAIHTEELWSPAHKCNVRLEIHHDSHGIDRDDLDFYGTFVSLNRRHVNYDPKTFDRYREHKHARILSYFEHGQCIWAPNRSIDTSAYPWSCPYDAVIVAGLWLPNNDFIEDFERVYGDDPAIVKERLDNEVEIACRVYTAWANGEVYGFIVYPVDDDDDALDSCWGFYGYDSFEQMVEYIKSEHLEVEQAAA